MYMGAKNSKTSSPVVAYSQSMSTAFQKPNAMSIAVAPFQAAHPMSVAVQKPNAMSIAMSPFQAAHPMSVAVQRANQPISISNVRMTEAFEGDVTPVPDSQVAAMFPMLMLILVLVIWLVLRR